VILVQGVREGNPVRERKKDSVAKLRRVIREKSTRREKTGTSKVKKTKLVVQTGFGGENTARGTGNRRGA